MKALLSKTLFFVTFFCCTTKFYSQLSTPPLLATSNVTEASQYGVLYQLDIPNASNYTSLGSILYSINNSSLNINYARVAYFFQLDSKWVWVSMNNFSTTNAQLSVPYANSGIIWQQIVTGMNVYSSLGAGVTNTTGINGNIEIWPDCYDTPTGLGGIGGNGGNYDFDDTHQAGTNCYGSFQVHNYGASETIFAYNDFMGGGALDLGIGNNTGNGNPDWTFMANASSYTTRKLWILVENDLKFVNQPSSLAQNPCVNGTVTALTVSATVNSGTITNYQWYSNTTSANTGGTLVATHTTSLTSDSYSPLSSTAGTLYYYCVVNGTGTLTALSNVSGTYAVANPTLTVTGTGTVCAGGPITLSAGTSIGASTFTWSNGQNTSSILVTPSVTTNYSVSGTSSFGCVAGSSIVTVTVNPLPAISVPNGTICNGGSFALAPSGASTYTYSGGVSTMAPVVTTNYTVSGTDALGCVGSNTAVSVVVYTVPVVSITGTTSICSGSSASLIANGAATYTWSNSSNASGISVSPASNTSYSLSGTSGQGCVSSSSAVVTVTVNALPVIGITGANTVCAGSSVALTAGGASTYSWNTGSNASVITVTPAGNTSYSVSGTSINGCVSSASAVTTVSVKTLPTIAITGTTSICSGASTSFTAGGATTYTWNTASNATVISVSPISNTSYSVSGTNSVGCISAAPAVVSLTVNALPLVSITGTNSICSGASTTLTANGASTYSWTGLGTTTIITVSPTANTGYTVTGTSSLGCVGLVAISNVTVNALPTVVISGTNAVCAGTTTSLTASGANTYTWTGLGSSTVIAVSPLVNTTYTATGTSTAGCINFATKTVTANALPTLTISGSTGICTGQNATLTVSGASTYSWNTGSTNTTIVTTPASNTIYTVTGTDALGCVKTNTQLVTVAASLSISISGPTAICLGQSANLGGLGGATYTWNTNATTTSISPSPTVTTTYSVIGASGTCSNTALKTVVVNPNPTVTIAGLNTICAGATSTLTASGAVTYSWSNASTSATVLVTPTATTIYSVTGQYTTGCSATAISTITVYSLPTLSIVGSTMVCAGSAPLLIVGGATTYTWNTGANTSTISPTNSGTYSAVGTDANGCVNSSPVTTVVVNPAPTLTIASSATTICLGDALTLTVTGANTYSWNNGAITSVITDTPGGTTTYTVTGTNTFSCSSSMAIAISVNPLPVLTVAGPTTICKGETATLTVNGATTYTWNNTTSGNSLSVTPTLSTTYSVTGTSVAGCMGSSNMLVNVSDCTGLNSIAASGKISVYPNPTNGNFTIELVDATDATITIRNVLGQLVINKKAELMNTIQLNEFNNGMYYLTITKNNAVVYSTSVIKN